jgi:endonuclease/exonuclease/phosphatase family metal-dependent hydrolase
VRVVTYNIRNIRAVDWSSLWWRRRRRLADVIGSLGADLIGVQEAYRSQSRWLEAHVLTAPEWETVATEGRNSGGGGEAVPLWNRVSVLRGVSAETRWFGPAPDLAGSRFDGARFPRIATLAAYDAADDSRVIVANLHLDSDDVANRTRSLEQLAEWLVPAGSSGPTIVLGDFNAPLDEPGFTALSDVGLRSALPPDAGPTSNGFGSRRAEQQQIDHVFVSDHFRIDRARIFTDAGHASDHYPVVVDLTLDG